MKSFGQKSGGSENIKFVHPRGVAITPDNFILVADNHKIYPLGIIIDGSNLMYFAEQNNHCISIFTTDGQFVRSFGGQGSSVGQFNVPCGITFDREGYLYVCDYCNNRLVVY